MYLKYKYRAPGTSMYFMLSSTQAGPGRTVKQEQEEISRNHVQTFTCLSVQPAAIQQNLSHLLDGIAGLDLVGLLVLLAVREDDAVRLVGRLGHGVPRDEGAVAVGADELAALHVPAYRVQAVVVGVSVGVRKGKAR